MQKISHDQSSNNASSNNAFLTPKRLEILGLLRLTMVTAHILVASGVVQGKNSLRNNLRSAQRLLRNLYKTGYAGFHSYPTKTGHQKYYFLQTPAATIPEQQSALTYHQILPGILTHDSITALFLAHLFRCCRAKGIAPRWYPPFMIHAKESDGGVSLTRNGEVLGSLILETDTGSQDMPEVSDKLESFVSCLHGNLHRKIVFLTTSEDRKTRLQESASEILRKKNLPEYEKRILCLIPTEFPGNFDIYPSILAPTSKVPAVPSEKEVPLQSEVPSEGTSKPASVSKGASKEPHPEAENLN